MGQEHLQGKGEQTENSRAGNEAQMHASPLMSTYEAPLKKEFDTSAATGKHY